MGRDAHARTNRLSADGAARSVPHQTTIRLARCPLMVAALLLVGRRSRGGLTSERATKAVAQWSSLVQGRPPGRQRRALGPASVAVVVLLAIVVGGVASAASYAATASAYGMGSGGDGTSSESNGRMVLSGLSGRFRRSRMVRSGPDAIRDGATLGLPQPSLRSHHRSAASESIAWLRTAGWWPAT